jgi:hypothetical protein
MLGKKMLQEYRTIVFCQEVVVSNYNEQLPCIFDIIIYFEFDLYQNAIVPVALAHRHASISFVPGGKVLKFVTRHGLSRF